MGKIPSSTNRGRIRFGDSLPSSQLQVGEPIALMSNNATALADFETRG